MQPDFTALLSLSDEKLYSELAPVEIGFLDNAASAYKAGYQWWQANFGKCQEIICATPGLHLICDAATLAASIFEALKGSLDEHRSAYVAVIVAKTTLASFCGPVWNPPK